MHQYPHEGRCCHHWALSRRKGLEEADAAESREHVAHDGVDGHVDLLPTGEQVDVAIDAPERSAAFIALFMLRSP